MGLLKWIRENNVNYSTNSKYKRRQSEPIQSIPNNRYSKYDKIHRKLIRDGDYVDAVLKFNDWRSKNGNNISNHNQINNKTRKYSLKFQKHFNDSLVYETPNKQSIRAFLNKKFHKIERLSLPSFRSNDKHRKNNYMEFENNKSLIQYDEVNGTIYNDIDKNSPIEFINSSCNESPPTKFYRKSINPFLNYKSPIKTNKNKKSLFHEIKTSSDDQYDEEITESEKDESSLSKKLQQKHLYHTVINKHGEPVEYALPMVFHKQFKQSNSEDLDMENAYISKLNEPVNLTEEKYETRRHVIVTDLDKSDGDIYQKVQAEAYPSTSRNTQFSKHRDNKIYDGNFSKSLNYIIKYKPHDIQIFPYGTINTSGSELQFGKVYNTKIMKLTYDKVNIYFKDNGSKRNVKLLSYFRHPNISLLMGIMYEENNQINSLYMESFSCNLHDLIHKTDKSMKIRDIIDFTQQIISATTFIHENNTIHSNICSHNILVSETKKKVKLTSFELATNTLPPEGLNINDINDENKISFVYLPYYINYRKQFSLHIYQAPELISTVQEFVYPVKQSDIYGICLVIWEMLNQSIPFALFSYSDLNKIFNSQTARLPVFEEDRNKLFKPILENGLIINLDERIKDIQNLTEFYNEIKVQYFKTSDSKDFEITRIFDSEDNPPRTSTLKRHYQKQIEPNYMNGSINQINIENETCVDWHQICENNSIVVKKKLPIAENTKILKENWLSENEIADIKIIRRTPKSAGSKIYNLNIRITPKNDTTPCPKSNYNGQLIRSRNSKENQISFTTSLNDVQKNDENVDSFGKIPVNNMIKKAETEVIDCEHANDQTNQSSSNVSQQINFWNSINGSTENNEIENTRKDKNGNEKNELINTTSKFNDSDDRNKIQNSPSKFNDSEDRNKILNRYYPGMPELLSETFNKNSSNKSFEDSQWKQERKICEAQLEQNKIDSEKQISVKDAINKFEVISNSPGNKSTSYKKLDNTLKCNIDSNKTDSIFESSLNVTLKSPRNDLIVKNDISKRLRKNQSIIKSASFNQSELNILPITPSDRHSICNPEIFKKLHSNIFNNAEHLSFTSNSTFLRRANFTGLQNLKCWNCGIKIFNINNELNLTSSRISNYQDAKSIEDLYIDDDFTNMELHSETFDAYL